MNRMVLFCLGMMAIDLTVAIVTKHEWARVVNTLAACAQGMAAGLWWEDRNGR